MMGNPVLNRDNSFCVIVSIYVIAQKDCTSGTRAICKLASSQHPFISPCFEVAEVEAGKGWVITEQTDVCWPPPHGLPKRICGLGTKKGGLRTNLGTNEHNVIGINQPPTFLSKKRGGARFDHRLHNPAAISFFSFSDIAVRYTARGQ